MQLRRIATLLLAAPIVVVAACPIPAATNLILAVDRTGSVNDADTAAWRPIAERFLSCMSSGHVSEYLIDEFTGTRAPLFNKDVPSLSCHTVQCVHKWHEEMIAFKHELGTSLNSAFSGESKSNKTDLFPIFQRAIEDRASTLMIFSDALATEDVNLEKVYVTPENIPALMGKVMAKHGWKSGVLKADIWIVLPSSARPRIGPNSRADLNAFYTVFSAALGSNLKLFNDHIQEGSIHAK